MSDASKLTARQKHLSDLYAGFFQYYQSMLKMDLPPYELVKLHLTTVFFDDLELLKTMRPIFESGVSNVEEKRAAARAALSEAQTIHNRTAGLKWQTVSEKDIVKGNF